MAFTVERSQLVAALHGMSNSGLSPGASGNVSVRTADGGMLISASGQSAGDIRPGDLVYIDSDGDLSKGQRKPSSEWRMHWQVYCDHPNAGGIVHCHSRYATVLACQRKAIPAFHYMVAIAGGDSIPCAEYAGYGTQALSDYVSAALQERRACLMANHGQIAYAADPLRALALAKDIEELAANYYLSLQGGKPIILSQTEMDDVLSRYAGYGNQD
ncbi:class II aldolase/adducin family protein [Zhongshania borealis]|uniref:Class II aldolase/adducin family protein n=1 Tax=Zhongshania borealis TaxID=889488 RepID=A0ABP7WUB3_9GAMM